MVEKTSSKSNTEMTKKSLNRIDYFRMIQMIGIYTILVLAVYTHEIFYKSPKYVEITLKNDNTVFKLSNEIVKIPNFNRMLFFFEVFIVKILCVGIIYFGMKNTRNYYRNMVVELLFCIISSPEPVAYFPYASLSPFRYLMFKFSLVQFLIVQYYRQKNKNVRPSSIARITVKSILVAIIYSVLEKIWTVWSHLSHSVPVEIYLKDYPNFLEPIVKFCRDSDFNLSNILVYSHGPQPISCFTIPLFFKRLNFIFVTKETLQLCADGVAGTLYHEIAHTFLIDNLIRLLVIFLIFFNGFFFFDRYIIPNLNIYKFSGYLNQGVNMIVSTKMLEYVICMILTLSEEKCDDNAIANPESAIGLLKFLAVGAVQSLPHGSFRTSEFAFSRYSVFSTHPSRMDRILRISKMFPDLVNVEIKYN